MPKKWNGEERRQIDSSMLELKSDIKEIKIMVSLTNGRVKALEIWRSFILGGLAVICVVILPILITLINTWLQK